MMAFDRRQPLMEEDFPWKTTIDGSKPLMEANLWWKTTFDDGRWPLIEDHFWWKTTFDGRPYLMEDFQGICTNLNRNLSKANHELAWNHNQSMVILIILTVTHYLNLHSFSFGWVMITKMPQSGVGSMQESTKGCLPQKVFFHQRSSSTEGRLPP